MLKQLHKHICLIICITLVNCSNSAEEPNNKQNNSIRHNGVLNAAFTFGAQSGLAWQAKNINSICQQHSKELDKIYNFNSMLMKNNLLPPVVAEVKDSLRLETNTIRLADRVIEIIAPAKFVSTPPTWRNYIHLDYKYPEAPDSTLLPKTYIERDMWDREIQRGWDAGVTQANNIFSQNLGRLNRDFSGIALYHALHAQNMISSPTSAKAKLGITGNIARMRINDQLIRITSHSNLNIKADNWNPALIANNTAGSNYVPRK